MKAQRPCEGIKVLALTSALAAPFATYQLALHGAEVITIEEPGVGDNVRRSGTSEGKKLLDQGMGASFLSHASNKRSLTLNLREPEGQEIFKKLAKDADVIVENFRVGTMDRYGIGYEAIRKFNPRIVYCALTGFGQTGPKKQDGALDPIIQAASGVMSMTGTPESGPLKVGATIMDYASGFSILSGVLMALLHRERTGEGQYVDVSMLETALVLMSATVSEVINTGMPTKLNGNQLQNDNQICDTFLCSDAYLFLVATRDKLRHRLWNAIGRPDMACDPRFINIDLVRENRIEAYDVIGKVFRTKTAIEWEEILSKAGVPAMKVHSIAEIAEHPQIKFRKLFHTLNDVPGVDQEIKVPLAPYRLLKTPASIESPPARLGQHTDEILRGIGYSSDDIAKLHSAMIV